jgi:hypothetical protein
MPSSVQIKHTHTHAHAHLRPGTSIMNRTFSTARVQQMTFANFPLLLEVSQGPQVANRTTCHQLDLLLYFSPRVFFLWFQRLFFASLVGLSYTIIISRSSPAAIFSPLLFAPLKTLYSHHAITFIVRPIAKRMRSPGANPGTPFSMSVQSLLPP